MERRDRLAAPVWLAAAAIAAAATAPPALGQAPDGPRVVSSPALGPDPAREGAWAEFFRTLPHGAEIGSLTVLLGNADDVRLRCGAEADGCYLPLGKRIVMPGAGLPVLGIAEEIARHEYGHHLAAQSDNAPFAPGLGTKRWFTQEHICERLRSGELVDDAVEGYERSVAEGFAEAYRVTSGGQSHDWIVDSAFLPDAPARRAILTDATHPWTGPRSRAVRGRLPAGGRATLRIRVPLDGDVRIRATARLRLDDDTGHVVARGRRRGGHWRLHFLDCGKRRLRLTLSGASSARYRVVLRTP
jgi:hypothetical protein